MVVTMPRGNNGHNYTEEEKQRVVAAYREHYGQKGGWLQALATELNRPKANLCRLARTLGLTQRDRTVLPEDVRYTARLCKYCGGEFMILRYNRAKTCSPKCCAALLGEATSIRVKAQWKERGHPRGMLGKTHTPEYCAKMSERVKAAWADPNSTMNSPEMRQRKSASASRAMARRIKERPESVYSRTHKGWLEFEGGAKRCYFRSGWEMNYAHYLDWLKRIGEILDWEYEADTFWFEGIKRGTRSYLPDFKVVEKDGAVVYHEVKGWMDQKSKTKLARMAKYHPGVRIVVIDEAQYKAIMKNSTLFLPQEGVEVTLL